MSRSAPRVTITRIVNSCVLILFGSEAVLTDPWFTERWHLHRGEPLGARLDMLPPLSAIVVSHGFVNHWDRRALAEYAYKDTTRVVVPTARMASQARRLGFVHVEELSWGHETAISDGLHLEAVEAQRSPLGRNNNYVFNSPDARVFVGGEAEAVAPLEAYGAAHPAVDLALLPVNGLSVPVKGRIVMGPEQAVQGAAALGATTLIPIHDAHANDWMWRFIARKGNGADAARYAVRAVPTLRVVDLPTGSPWQYQAGPPSSAVAGLQVGLRSCRRS